MKPRNETEILRRRATGQADAIAQRYQAPSSFNRPDLYLVTTGGTFPTTGLNTVFMVQALDEIPPQDTEGPTGFTPTASGGLHPAINLGEAIPVQDQTIVRCDQIDGQLFFTYRGKA